MPAAIFLDTNVVIYAATGKKTDPRKWEIALDLLARQEATVSAQVLAEFYAIVLQKRYLNEWDATFWLERLVMMPVVDVDAALVLEGVAISQRYRIKYWDGAVVAASARSGAATLYTEDLNHNQTYGSVRAVNPFLEP